MLKDDQRRSYHDRYEDKSVSIATDYLYSNYLGDEAYHADCFRCVQCSKKIDDLVFTQTSKGIYCTKCHEARKLLRIKRRDERNNVCYG